METVHSLNNETIDGLQKLIEINIDSGKGFEKAAENIENSEVAGYFRRCGQQRQGFAGELSKFVGMNGEKPEDSGTLKGAAHRWWIGVRGTVQDGDEHGILAEAERGEDEIKARYENVIKSTAGSALNDVLLKQYGSVKSAHDTIRDMRDARA